MKNLFFVIAFLFTGQYSICQTFEIAQDKGHRYELEEVLNIGDSIWVTVGNYYFGTVGEHSMYIQAVDNEGSLIWEYQEVSTLIYNLIQTDGGGILAIGLPMSSCDVNQSSPLSMLFFNTDGDLINTEILNINVAPWQNDIYSCSTSEVIFVGTKNMIDFPFLEYNQLLATSLEGDLLWTENFGEIEVLKLANFYDAAAVFFESQIVLVDEQGNRTDSVSYAQAPIDVLKYDENSILALWPDGVYTINSDLEIEVVIDFEADASTRILAKNNMIYLIKNNELFPFNTDFEPQTSVNYDLLPYFTPKDYAISNYAIAIVGSKRFEEVAIGNQSAYRSGVFYTVSLNGEQLEHFPDLAIGTIWIETSSVVQTNDNPMLFTIDVDVMGYIVNTGDVTVNSANVTFMGDQGICGFTTKSTTLENIMLAPGDSILFELNELRYTQQHFPSGSGSRTFCVFVSEPEELSDRDETNDISCVTQSFSVGIFEHSKNESVNVYPNPATDRVVIDIEAKSSILTYQIFDLSGRMVQNGTLPSVSYPELNVLNLQRGSYLLHLQSDDNNYVSKIILVDY